MQEDLSVKIEIDGWHCDPDCPYLDSEKEHCKKTNEEIMWHDYFVANCTTQDA